MDSSSPQKIIALEKMDLPALKKVERREEIKIIEKQKVISSSIKELSKGVKLSPAVKERFEKEFNRNNARLALRWVIVSFAVVLIFVLFLQPSIYASSKGSKILISNLTWHEVKNVTVFDTTDLRGIINGSAKPIFQLSSIASGDYYVRDMNRYGTFLVFADRQLPSISVLSPDPNPLTNTINNGQDPSTLNDKFNDLAN